MTARIQLSRARLAINLIGIHKEAWIPAGIAGIGTWLLWPTTWIIAPIALAVFVANEWRRDGAYRRNAQDTLVQRFHHQWRLAAIDDPDSTPHLVAVHIERATGPEARAIRRNQGRHALNARSLTITVRPKPHQATAKDWAPKFQADRKARHGFQTATDPRPAPLDNNALEFTFGQERLPTEVRAVVA